MDFQDYLVPGKTGLLIGIGGVSMSPLAEVLHDAGLDIRGSDMSESDNTLTLRERGIPIHIGHSAANVTDDIEFVIRTAAVHDDNPEVHEAHRRGINSFLSGSVSLKDALQRSARLLSEITGQVAVVASPSLAKATLRHVEMVPVAMTTLLAVVITDTGRVAQHGLTIASMPAVDEINRLSNTVNEQCDGLSLSKSAETVRSIAASAGYESVRGVADALADAFESMALDERANELYMSGTSHLAHSRSLADLAPLFDALEEQVVLMKLMSNLSEETNASGVGVAIGPEMHTPVLLHASVVSSGYGRSGAAGEPAGNDPVGEPETESETESQTNDTEPIAFVGSIGPTHMDYAATMAAVRAVARYLTAFLSEGRTQD